MIFEYIRSQLEKIDELKGNVFPSGGAVIDEIEGPFVEYVFQKRTSVRDLSGEIHHYRDEIVLGFQGTDYDTLHDLYFRAEELLAVTNQNTGSGEYIFSVETSSPAPDGYNSDNNLLIRMLQLNVIWCPI